MTAAPTGEPMRIDINVDTQLFQIDLDVMEHICPLCSRFEDHRHSVKLYSDPNAQDQIDGEPLSKQMRRMVVELMHGGGGGAFGSSGGFGDGLEDEDDD